MNRLTLILASFVLFVSTIVISGWLSHISWLIQVSPSVAPMQFNTAITFFLLTFAFLFQMRGLQKLFWIASLCVLVILILTFLEYILTMNLGIDDFFIKPYITTETKFPGRMGINTLFAFSITWIAIALIQAKSQKYVSTAGFLGLFVFGLGATTITGYFLSLKAVYNWGAVTSMAIQSAFCFICLGSAMLLHSYFLLRKANYGHFKNFLFGIALIFQAIFFLIDMVVPLGVTAGITHVIVLVIISFNENKNQLNFILFTSLVVIWIGYFVSPAENINWIVMPNRLLTCFVCILVYFLLRNILKKSVNLRNQNESLDRIVNARTIELQSRNKELEQFAYISAHDLQEPMRTISSYAQLLSDTNRSKLDELGKRSVDYIQSSSDRIQKLIKGLLDYARLGSQKELKNVDFKILFSHIESDFENLFAENEVSLLIDEVPPFSAFEDEVYLLFKNLITNCIKYKMPGRKPVIKITYEEDKEFHIFKVKDNGMGIAPPFLDRIFHLFQRLHSQDEIEGTGIGLSLCKKITAMHQGDIWVESSVNSGSTFFVTLSKKIKHSLND